jgi:hypothetical protein
MFRQRLADRPRRPATLMMEATGMRDMERDNKNPKKETGDQMATKAPKAPATTGSAVLETVRQKMAYTIRGI